MLAILERRRDLLGSKISGCGQLAEVAVYLAVQVASGRQNTARQRRHLHWVPILLQKSATAAGVVGHLVSGDRL